MTTIGACVIFWKQRNSCGLTSLLAAFFITAVRAVILAITSPWQTDAASSSTAELVSCTHGRGCRTHAPTHAHTRAHIEWLCSVFQLDKRNWQNKEKLYTNQALTAVLLIRLVVTVKFSVTPPASIDAHPAAAHEFNWSAGLVGSCLQTHGMTSETQQPKQVTQLQSKHFNELKEDYLLLFNLRLKTLKRIAIVTTEYLRSQLHKWNCNFILFCFCE